ncbi:DUF4333 domain-containing protein [Actinopolymorpha singaporensis]
MQHGTDAHNPQPVWPAMPPQPVRADRGSPSKLAIVSLVLSGIALIGVIALLVLFLGGGPDGGGPLTGKLATSSAGVRGADLEDVVTNRITDDGGDVEAMRCPDVASVAQGVVAVCHGSISGDDWAVIVYFEDAQGHYTLDPI